MNKITPIGNRVLVNFEKPRERVQGSLILPASVQDSPSGEIATVMDFGELVPDSIKNAQKVLVSRYACTSFKLNGEDLFITPFEQILGLITEVQ